MISKKVQLASPNVTRPGNPFIF